MYAVIETGGKQYRVELGTELEVELLDATPGQEISLNRILLVADGDTYAVGRPVVPDAAVRAEVVRQDRGEKTVAFKYKPKARSRVKKGHRQELTVLRITDVRLGSRSAAEQARAAETEAADEKSRVARAAARQAAEDQAIAEKLKARESAVAAEPTGAPSAPKARPAGRGRTAKTTTAEPATAETEPQPEPKAKVTRRAPKGAAAPEPEAAQRPSQKAAAAPEPGAPRSSPKPEPAGGAAPRRPSRSTKKDE